MIMFFRLPLPPFHTYLLKTTPNIEQFSWIKKKEMRLSYDWQGENYQATNTQKFPWRGKKLQIPC